MPNRTRRDWLRVVGATAVGGVAGCSSSEERTETAAPPPEVSTEEETELTEGETTETTSPLQQAKFAPDDGDSGDSFGGSMTLSSDGSTALTGAVTDEDPNGEDAGSAYVFHSAGDSWTQQAKLVSDDGTSNDRFGDSVALSSDGSTALIGERGDGEVEDSMGYAAGSAHVFESAGDSWAQQAKLIPDDGDSNDRFGDSVALSSDGSTALIGAHNDEDPNGMEAGSAYVFDSAGGSWSQQAKLAADDGDRIDLFGGTVALSSDGSTALIGAEDAHGDSPGSAYVFDSAGGSWSQQAKLAADDGDSDDRFGGRVAVSSDGSTALIGAPRDEDPNGDGAGSAYVFDSAGGSWSQQAKLAPDDGDSNDFFGSSVTLSSDGSTALIGAHLDDDPNGNGAGSAYVFNGAGGSWSQQAKFAPDDGDSNDFFGSSVTLSSDGSTACIGASGDEDLNGDGAGSAYVFNI